MRLFALIVLSSLSLLAPAQPAQDKPGERFLSDERRREILGAESSDSAYAEMEKYIAIFLIPFGSVFLTCWLLRTR